MSRFYGSLCILYTNRSDTGDCLLVQKWTCVWDVNDTTRYVSVMTSTSMWNDSAGQRRSSTRVASTSATAPGAVRSPPEHTVLTPVATPCWERSLEAVDGVRHMRLRRPAVSPPAYVQWIYSTATNNKDTSTSGSLMTSSPTHVVAAEAVACPEPDPIWRDNIFSLQFLPRCMECRRGLAMRILSVCPSNAWILTKRKKNQSRFSHRTKDHLFSLGFREKRMVGGGPPLLPEILGQPAPVGAKSPIMNR